MYLWVLIAIFISALAALGTSLRPDIKDLYMNTQAETEITQIYTLHRATLKYIDKHPEIEGKIDPNTISAYLPFGFQPGNFVSMSYCLNSIGTDIPNECQTQEEPEPEEVDPEETDPNENTDEENNETTEPNIVSDGTCCTRDENTHYVITYGTISLKWTNVYTGKPKVELLDAMKNKVGYVDGLGYAVNKAADDPYMGENDRFDTLGSDMGVVTHGTIPYAPIPQYIISSNPDFNSGGKCSGDGNYCLVYISKITH